MIKSRRKIFVLPAPFFVFFASASVGKAADTKSKDILLNTMQQELQRATGDLGKLTPAPYFLSYQVQDQTYALAVPYGYLAKAMGQRNSPRLLYKVFIKDGHEELVRGGIFGDLDTRAMRNDIVAAGDRTAIANRPTATPHSIASPSLLFDELEVKRIDQNKEKLPEYPAPQLGK